MLTELTLGEKLKDLRLAKGYKNTDDLAKAVNIPKTTLNDYENDDATHSSYLWCRTSQTHKYGKANIARTYSKRTEEYEKTIIFISPNWKFYLLLSVEQL